MNQKIIDILVEYGCNPEDFDVYKVAEEIRGLVLADLWKTSSCTYCPHCGAHKANYKEMMHTECCAWREQ